LAVRNFEITLFFCVGWPRPFIIGGVFAAVAALREGLQAFTPDRSAYLPAIRGLTARRGMVALVREALAEDPFSGTMPSSILNRVNRTSSGRTLTSTRLPP
jgi:hypothetical protein